MKPIEQDELHVRGLLPWYVNGTLDAESQGRLESQLEQLPHLQSELAWLRQLREQIRGAQPARADERSAAAGLDTLIALIHAEQSGKVVPMRAKVSPWVAAPRWFPAAAGLAAAVVLVQSLVLGALLNGPSGHELVPLSGGRVVDGQVLQVTFKPAATEVQIRKVLADVQGDIVSGPGALGVYAVRVPEGQGLTALQKLQKLQKDRNTVDSVVLLQDR